MTFKWPKKYLAQLAFKLIVLSLLAWGLSWFFGYLKKNFAIAYYIVVVSSIAYQIIWLIRQATRYLKLRALRKRQQEYWKKRQLEFFEAYTKALEALRDSIRDLHDENSKQNR